MAKQKLTLSAAPTFKCAVGIPVPGQKDTAPVEFTFRHRTKADIKTWRDSHDLEADGVTTDIVRDIATAWDLEDPFDDESIGRMLDQYPGSGIAIYVRYLQELQDARLGNFGR